jgi:hypothetical protein
MNAIRNTLHSAITITMAAAVVAWGLRIYLHTPSPCAAACLCVSLPSPAVLLCILDSDRYLSLVTAHSACLLTQQQQHLLLLLPLLLPSQDAATAASAAAGQAAEALLLLLLLLGVAEPTSLASRVNLKAMSTSVGM